MALKSVLPFLLILMLIIIINQNVVNSYVRHRRHHHRHQPQQQQIYGHRFGQQRVLGKNDCENCQMERPKTVELQTLKFWNCDFNLNDCGIHNQHNMDSRFLHRSNSSEPIFGKNGLLYLDLKKCRSSGARLITPYFPTNGCRYGCLTIEYMMCGLAVKSLYLIQQDVRNYCIWQRNNDFSNRWINSSITIDLIDTKPRFFIETHFQNLLNNFGFIAISNLMFTYGTCAQNEANECALNQYIGRN